MIGRTEKEAANTASDTIVVNPEKYSTQCFQPPAEQQSRASKDPLSEAGAKGRAQGAPAGI